MKKVLGYFVISRIVFILFVFFGSFLFPLQEGYLGKQIDLNIPYFFWIWANFDGRHYLNIAINGYNNFDFAFFPLYPLIINVSQNLLPFLSPIFLGITVSVLSLIGSFYVIYQIIKLDYDQKIAQRSLLILTVFPLSFFYHSVYPDSLFLLLTTVCFYFARKGNWILVGVFGFLSTLTRLSGLALIPALFVEWYLQHQLSLKSIKNINIALLKKFFNTCFITLILTFFGILSYMIYLGIFFHDPFLFQKSMIAWGQNQTTFPPQVIYRYLKIFLFVDKNLVVYWIAVLEFLSMFLYLGLSLFVIKKIRISYGIFMLALLSLVTFTGTFAGTPRYLLHLFPAFLGLALILKNERVLKFVIFVFLILGFLLTSLFIRGYFVS